MSEFYIDIDKCRQVSADLPKIRNNVRAGSAQVSRANSQLKKNLDSGMSVISSRLLSVNERIIEEAARAESLSSALDQIISAYSACESEIIGEGNQAFGSQNEKKPKNKTWLDKLIDYIKKILGIKDKPELSEERRLEREHDLFMQDQIFSMMKSGRFSEEAWNKASLTERKAILNEFMAQIALIMGISVNGGVHFFNESPKNGLITNGYYSPDDNTISINTYVVDGNNSYKIMQTMIHEMRHAYQHAAVNNPDRFQVSTETIEQWKNNFDHYINGSDDFAGYQAQPIEYDANSFAKNYGSTDGVNPTYRGSW